MLALAGIRSHRFGGSQFEQGLASAFAVFVARVGERLQPGVGLVHPQPAAFVHGRARLAYLAEFGQNDAMKDVDSYKAKLEADVRKDVEAKVRKEIEAEQKKKADKEAAIDPSLASTSSKGGLTSDDYAGPTPLDEILK